MIAQLRGTVIRSDGSSVVIDVMGIGYRVFVTTECLAALKKEGGAVTLHTHLAVRENSQDLYGFLSEEELVFFELLISVSGIGPKSALAILSLAHVTTIRQAVLQNDTTYLTKVSGIGKKNAEKIVLELSDKIGALESELRGTLKEDVDTLEALTSLGYSHNEARDALKRVPKEHEGANERLKEALKMLGK